MFKPTLQILLNSLSICISTALMADCCQTLALDAGWRRDYLDWRVTDIDSSYVNGHADSHILFKDIESYTLTAKAKWTDTNYYVRASAEYGLTDKGRAHENFSINSKALYCPVEAKTNDPIKRRSAVYDFNLAAGYPFTLCNCRLSFIPLVGFSYHRQHLRVKGSRHDSHSSSCYCSDYSGSEFTWDSLNPSVSPYSRSKSSSGSSHFSLSAYNPFRYSYQSSDAFSSSSSEDIAYELGLYNERSTSAYRFTWYGFFIGTDIAYALDCNWTLYTELEYHFLDRCHQKRKSWTGVSYVDDYHNENWASGFNGVVGLTYAFSTDWYSNIAVDFNYWKADGKHNHLEWKKVGAKIGVGYMF